MGAKQPLGRRVAVVRGRRPGEWSVFTLGHLDGLRGECYRDAVSYGPSAQVADWLATHHYHKTTQGADGLGGEYTRVPTTTPTPTPTDRKVPRHATE